MSNEMIPENSMIIAEGQYYDLDCYKTKRNNNVLVVGAAGTGKTRSIVTPNILQATGSYIISDPKGNLYLEYGDYLRKKGYNVKLLNFDEPENSIKYNFFKYIHSEKDILKAAHMLIYGKKDGKSGNGIDPFWDRTAEILLVSLIDYLIEFRPEHERTLDSVLKLVEAGGLNEDSPSTKSALERVMDEVKKRSPQSIAYRYFQNFNVAAIRTRQSILVTLASHLGRFNFKEAKAMLSSDETCLEMIGHEKTAFFVQVSDTDRSMDDLANLFFTQAMNELCYEADKHCEGNKLPISVRFILDDFATNCTIQDFPRMISSIRSRGISTMLMIQAEEQLKSSFGADAGTIISNCDTYIYIGCNDIDTAQKVAIRSNQLVQNILYMPIETAWIFRRGEKPVNCRIFNIDEHIGYWIKEKSGTKECAKQTKSEIDTIEDEFDNMNMVKGGPGAA